ncbi:MAG: NADH-quinone oxidoreductase subunit D [Thermoplasmatota archaeon]
MASEYLPPGAIGKEAWDDARDKRDVAPPRIRLVTLNIGPQHPSTHGVLRLKVVLEGEVIRDVEPVIGYLHRGTEKLFEEGSYLQAIPLTDRLDYIAAMHNNYAWCHSVEMLMGATAQVPERAQYIRAITMEINRIASHLLWLGTFGLDVGALTPFFWCVRDREGALALLERLSGARITFNWYRIGGVKNDLPEGFLDEVQRFLDWMPARLKEYEDLLSDNDIFRMRTDGVGVLTREQAIDFGCSGPMLRGSGVDFDLRRDEPFNPVYQKVKWRVPVGKKGDNYSRYRVRMDEMYESLRILQQLITSVPAGDYIAPEIGEGARQHRVKPPVGEVYGRVEGARGEYGVYLVSDGTARPWRAKWRAPTLANLSPLAEMTRGALIPDLVSTLGSIDLVLGDLDR